MSTSTNSYNEFRSSAFSTSSRSSHTGRIVSIVSTTPSAESLLPFDMCQAPTIQPPQHNCHHYSQPTLALIPDLLFVGFWYFLCLVVVILKHRKCSLFFCQRNSFSFSSSFWIKPNLTATVTAITRPIFGLLWSEGVSFSKWSILTKERGMGHYPSIALWKFWNLFFLWNIVLW